MNLSSNTVFNSSAVNSMADRVGTTGTAASQVIWAGNGTGMSTSMNSSSHKDETETGDSTDGELDNGDQYMKFRWALAKSYTYDGIKVPKMTISFDLSNALRFSSDTATCANDNPAFLPGKPSISNRIEPRFKLTIQSATVPFPLPIRTPTDFSVRGRSVALGNLTLPRRLIVLFIS